MAVLTATAAAAAGVTLSGAAASAGGDSFVNTGKEVLVVKNTGGSDCILTFTTPITVDGQAVAERTVTVPATTGYKVIGPFRPGVYNDTGIVGGSVAVAYDQVTSVTVQLLSVTSLG